MAPAQQVIQAAVNKSRRDWMEFSIAQDKKLYRMLSDTAAQVEARINQLAIEGKVPSNRLLTLLGSPINPKPDSIRGMIRELRPKIGQHIKFGMRNSINEGMKSQIRALTDIMPATQLMVGSSFIGKDGKIRMYDVAKEKWPDSRWGKINGRAMDFLVRTDYAGETISRRVWGITHDAEKLIRARINTGVLLGDSAASIARDCKAYLREPYRRFHRIAKDGRLVLSAPAKRYKPGRGVYRSSYRNAMRFARTESSRAYNEGVVRYGRDKRWIKGWISRVGSDNPAPYDESVNGRFFPKDSPPNIPYHPQCMCHAELVLSETPDEQLVAAHSEQDFEKGITSVPMSRAGGVKRPRTVA